MAELLQDPEKCVGTLVIAICGFIAVTAASATIWALISGWVGKKFHKCTQEQRLMHMEQRLGKGDGHFDELRECVNMVADEMRQLNLRFTKYISGNDERLRFLERITERLERIKNGN
jgi:hypothetical protein